MVGKGAWTVASGLGSTLAVQSNVVVQTAPGDDGSQNNSPNLPTDWSLPWTIEITLTGVAGNDSGVICELWLGLPADPNPMVIAIQWMPGDFAADQISTIGFDQNAQTVGFLAPTAGATTPHVYKVQFDGTNVSLYVDNVLQDSQTYTPINTTPIIVYEINNLLSTATAHLSLVSISHP